MSWQGSETTVVLVRDVSSGRIHKRFRVEGSKELMSYEADNADEAGAFVEIDESDLADMPHDARCNRCFPAGGETPPEMPDSDPVPSE